MTKAKRDRVREIIIEKVMKHRKDCDCMACRKGGWIDQAETAIREAIALELPKKFDSQDRSNEGFNRDYRTGYNQAIQDAQAKIREEG